MRTIARLTCGVAVVALALAGCSKETGTPVGSGPGADAKVDSLVTLADLVKRKSTEKQAAHVTIAVDAGGEAITGAGDMRFGDKPAMDLKMSVPEMAELTLRFVDGVFYFKLPEEPEPGKPWVKIDTNGTDELSQALGNVVAQMKDSGDPSQLLSNLQRAGTITATKTEQLNGKSTTHYTVTVDVAKLAAQQPALAAATKAGISSFPLDVWLDADNLPARITVNTPYTDPKTQQTAQVKVQADYTDWGKRVDVTAPPAGEIAKLPQ
jgi:hypothetical protein